jgi:hypothetical protein
MKLFIAIGTRAADAYKTVDLVTIAFSGIAVILTYWAPNIDDLMSEEVAATLHHEAQVDEKVIEDASSSV